MPAYQIRSRLLHSHELYCTNYDDDYDYADDDTDDPDGGC